MNKGAPSYNSGHLFGEFTVNTGKALYENSNYKFRGKICKWEIEFKDNSAIISTLDFNNKCGFGKGVYVDGVYDIRDKNIPESYIDSLGNTQKF